MLGDNPLEQLLEQQFAEARAYYDAARADCTITFTTSNGLSHSFIEPNPAYNSARDRVFPCMSVLDVFRSEGPDAALLFKLGLEV